MRQLFSLLIVLAAFTGCSKENREPDFNLVDLSVVSTNLPAQVPKDQEIAINGTWSGSDLCYHFSHFEIKEAAPRTFDIRAKATYPNGKKRDVICLQAVYYFDTTIKINPSTTGQYLLRYYNGTQVTKTDTVQVN